MRRSAAPSTFSLSKKPRFVVPYASPPAVFNKENTCLSSKSSAAFVGNIATVSQKNQHARSTADILKLISDPSASSVEGSDDKCSLLCSEEESARVPHLGKIGARLPFLVKQSDVCDESPSVKLLSGAIASPTDPGNANNPIPTIDSRSISYYSVVWCKRSMKKHKKWEGDAVLIIEGRSAILKDMEGKEIGRGIGYKEKEVNNLEEGGTFYIGGKECEIQNEVSSADYLSGKCFHILGENNAPALPID